MIMAGYLTKEIGTAVYMDNVLPFVSIKPKERKAKIPKTKSVKTNKE